jgi:TetR/AcrR family transcriptional regulator, transcriptional repressor for nem operon
MEMSRPATIERPTARTKLIDAAHATVRTKGYAGTSVDDLCAAAGVTKGAFFHHFASKEALAVAAAQAWTDRADKTIFSRPEWVAIRDPLDRVLAHIDLRSAMLDGPAEGFTCFVGTMVQEAFATSDTIRAACDASIGSYAERLAKDIDEAIEAYGVSKDVTALSLAYHIQAVLQGGFILAKASGDASLARESVAHLRRYTVMLFGREIDQ